MGWGGQTWLKLIQEGTGGTNYGVFNAAPTAGQAIFPVLLGDNAFTVRRTPLRQVIRTSDTGNRRRNVVAARRSYVGTFNTVLFPDEAAFWITAATSLTNDATLHPWLPSYSALFWDSQQAWKFLGGMCRSLTLTSTATQDYVSLSMTWIFQTRDPTFTTFAQPAESNYSQIVPYEHVETAGNFTQGGVAVTKYRSLNVSFNNQVQETWDELPDISALYYCGRDLDFTFAPQYLATTNRGLYEAQTPLTFVVGWARTSPAHALTINCKTNSYMSSLDDELPLGNAAYQPISVQVNFDPANNTDFTTTVS
jgi:hypothetical protein